MCIEIVSGCKKGGTDVMVQTNVEKQKIGEVLELLRHIPLPIDMEDGTMNKISHVRYEDESNVTSTSEISLHFMNMPISLHNLMPKSDYYIDTFYQCSEKFPVSSCLLVSKEKDFDEREAFCKSLHGGSDGNPEHGHRSDYTSMKSSQDLWIMVK